MIEFGRRISEAFSRILSKQHLISIIVTVPIVFPTVWMLLDRELPYVRVAGHIAPDDPGPKDFITVKWDIILNRKCPPSESRNVTRTVIDHAGVVHDYDRVEGQIGTAQFPKHGNTSIITRSFQLPASMAEGEATYKSSACFACNITQYLWPVCVTKPELIFNSGKGPT